MSLAFGSMGNGTTIWLEGTDTKVAHISENGEVLSMYAKLTQKHIEEIKGTQETIKIQEQFLNLNPWFRSVNEYWVSSVKGTILKEVTSSYGTVHTFQFKEHTIRIVNRGNSTLPKVCLH